MSHMQAAIRQELQKAGRKGKRQKGTEYRRANGRGSTRDYEQPKAKKKKSRRHAKTAGSEVTPKSVLVGSGYWFCKALFWAVLGDVQGTF